MKREDGRIVNNVRKEEKGDRNEDGSRRKRKKRRCWEDETGKRKERRRRIKRSMKDVDKIRRRIKIGRMLWREIRW